MTDEKKPFSFAAPFTAPTPDPEPTPEPEPEQPSQEETSSSESWLTLFDSFTLIFLQIFSAILGPMP